MYILCYFNQECCPRLLCQKTACLSLQLSSTCNQIGLLIQHSGHFDGQKGHVPIVFSSFRFLFQQNALLRQCKASSVWSPGLHWKLNVFISALLRLIPLKFLLGNWKTWTGNLITFGKPYFCKEERNFIGQIILRALAYFSIFIPKSIFKNGCCHSVCLLHSEVT